MAYAWRQMLVFLSRLPVEEASAFADWADEWLLARQALPMRERMAPLMQTLRDSIRAPADARVDAAGALLLGWSPDTFERLFGTSTPA